MHLPNVQNPALKVVKHANPHCTEEGGLQVVAHDAGNVPKHVETPVNMV
jgi:hypothetical protein